MRASLAGVQAQTWRRVPMPDTSAEKLTVLDWEHGCTICSEGTSGRSRNQLYVEFVDGKLLEPPSIVRSWRRRKDVGIYVYSDAFTPGVVQEKKWVQIDRAFRAGSDPYGRWWVSEDWEQAQFRGIDPKEMIEHPGLCVPERLATAYETFTRDAPEQHQPGCFRRWGLWAAEAVEKLIEARRAIVPDCFGELEKIERVRRSAVSAQKEEHARVMLKRAIARTKRAETIEGKWRRRVIAYERARKRKDGV